MTVRAGARLVLLPAPVDARKSPGVSLSASTFDVVTTKIWQPLSAREAGDTALREGVPPAMESGLRAWIHTVALRHANYVERVLVRLDLIWGESDKPEYERLAYETLTCDLLAIADALLNLLPKPAQPLNTSKWGNLTVALAFEDLDRFRNSLQQLLDDARSVYQVKGDITGLIRRVDPLAAQMLSAAVKAAAAKPDAGSAAAQLRAASDAVRALKPEPDKAYGMAIKAAESAAHAVIEPTNPRATLGTMLKVMKTSSDKFTLAIPGKDGRSDVAPVIAMMVTLWEGQSSRHGAQKPIVMESPEAAEMAVQVASVLVLWFTTGMVRRKA